MIVLGGTFDPVHNGHLHCANAVSELFDGREVRMMLAAQPNLKIAPVASAEDRWQMLQLACESYPHLTPDDFELNRGKLSTTGVTASMLGGNVSEPVVWVIGSDSARQVPQWRDQDLLQKCVSFLVVPRSDVPHEENVDGFRRAESPNALSENAGHYWFMDHKALLLSSTEIRRQASTGMYINGLVPYPVYVYIRTHSIYLDKSEAYS